MQTASDFRNEARSLALSAERQTDRIERERFYFAASRCGRMATLLERGIELDEAARRVTIDYGASR